MEQKTEASYTTIEEITGKSSPKEQIEALQSKTIEVPAWEDLKKEYDPKLHPVMDKTAYPDIVDGAETEKVTRTTYGFQRLAADRMSQLTFGIPVKRVYKPKKDNEKEKTAASIIEKIYTKNRIDSINMKRGKMLFAGCEVATLWYAVEGKNSYYGEESLLKIRCKNYSPMDSQYISAVQTANIYPYFDEYDDLVALSFGYSRKKGDKDVQYFDTYTSTKHIRFSDESGDWAEELVEDITIEKIPGVYIYRSSPIWESTSDNIYEIEWSLSRNGNYIRKNSKPYLALFADEEIPTGDENENGGEKNENEEFKAVGQFPKGSDLKYVTWQQAIESLKFHVQENKANSFTEIQIPDISYESMKSTPMSGEARKMLFTDAHLKVTQESGDFLEFFDRELNIIRALAKKAFPKYADAFDTLDIEHIITPYFINDDETKANTLTTATGGSKIMSQRTAIAQFGQVDDVDAELDLIKEEEMRNLSEPTDLM